MQYEEKGIIPASLDTEAIVSMDGTGITGVHLSVTRNVPGVSSEESGSIAKGAEQNCLIAKVLKIPVTSEAVLVFK
ncbi:OsmC family protein [Dyadobacter flavalbus]|uniref:OsmC family protein n=1 Tax=Dyadobacter flavalbus TaxID=2579942 RepID=UPI00191C1619|nr:hypothetical protein [Dyadobacter flavalbus]